MAIFQYDIIPSTHTSLPCCSGKGDILEDVCEVGSGQIHWLHVHVERQMIFVTNFVLKGNKIHVSRNYISEATCQWITQDFIAQMLRQALIDFR